MPVRMIASDLDGTLLDEHGRLSVRTVAAIVAASARGILVVAATGRSHLTAAPRLAAAGSAMRWAICSNGASLFDLHASEVVRHHRIDDPTLAALARLRSDQPELAWAWETTAGFGAQAAFHALHPGADGLLDSQAVPSPPSSDIVKFLVGHPFLIGRELIEHLRLRLPSTVEVATSGAPFVEITGRGVNKATGIERLASGLGIAASDVMVFGDNHNDLPMFEWAGRSVAVANAVPAVLDIADEVAAHHGDDGVARVIERLVAGA